MPPGMRQTGHRAQNGHCAGTLAMTVEKGDITALSNTRPSQRGQSACPGWRLTHNLEFQLKKTHALIDMPKQGSFFAFEIQIDIKSNENKARSGHAETGCFSFF